MCTAISYNADSHYFGRTLDLEYSYNESVVITPKNYIFNFRDLDETANNHYAIIGIGIIMGNYPLYYDAVNEKGLGIAGLNFPNNAHYFDNKEDKINVASFELIPYILSHCENLSDAMAKFEQINITKTQFSENLPTSPLHWIVSDKTGSFVAEQTKDGMKIYDNPFGVMTNNPPFYKHLKSLEKYVNLSPSDAGVEINDKLTLSDYAAGMGALGLPGDMSSSSRFIRACFITKNAKRYDNKADNIEQFFHIMDYISMIDGCVILKNGAFDKTVYTSCCDTATGVYYYTTSCNRRINSVKLHSENLNGEKLIQYDFYKQQSINYQN